MDSDARSPVGRFLTLESLDYSSQISEILVGKAHDFGAAADYNTDLLKRNNNETGELALPVSLSTTLLGSSYAATLVPEAQVRVSVGFDSGKWNEIFPAEPNVEVSMAGFIEAGDISKRLSPTPLVNFEGISGQIATAPSFSPNPQELSTHGSHDVALRGQKGRLSCDYPGCKQTFPRKYELTRHTKTIHTQDFRVVCPVYGCHRTAKPFKRADKFMEHFRKHDSSRSYRCLIEDCQSAPFDILGLSDHLTKRHHMDYNAQPNLEFIHYTVLGSRFVPFWLYRLRLNGRDTCPLAPTGCTHRVTADYNEDLSKLMMRQHILNHEFSDRRLVSELLSSFFIGNDNRLLDDGTNNCMVCSFQVSGYFHREFLLDQIMKDHSPEERGSVLENIHQILVGFAELLWNLQYCGKQPNLTILGNECRAAGFTFHSWQESILFLNNKGT
ncbi:hypothetical protein BHYA_0035g00360 [Botrytis hyacinthi]|uniref:C2H2-type domain-containing protein n=1 Tax=Botrytis hyacinthi TaxID=278943 RepID=A0A4Z1GYT6_9HELO|nr:hypothetical protein BHYA_0035g00360 [Botrytis hyacinthi]